MAVASARLHPHSETMVKKLVVQHEPHKPGRHSRLVQKGMDADGLLLRRVAPQADGALGSAHSPPKAPGNPDGRRLTERPRGLLLKQRLKIMGSASRSEPRLSSLSRLRRWEAIDEGAHGRPAPWPIQHESNDHIERVQSLIQDSLRDAYLKPAPITTDAHETHAVLRDDHSGRLWSAQREPALKLTRQTRR